MIVFIQNDTYLFNLVIIYRPLINININNNIHMTIPTNFFYEFSNFIIDINISYYIIVGDFNCHSNILYIYTL